MKCRIFLGALTALAALPALAQSTTTVKAGDVIGGYKAYISRSDIVNSNGVRLSEPWQIIRQDRANFHVYGIRDRGDEDDSFFSDAANRQNLEAMLAAGSMSDTARRMILRGDCWVEVRVHGRAGRGDWLDVEVSE